MLFHWNVWWLSIAVLNVCHGVARPHATWNSGRDCQYPELIEATVDQLQEGLAGNCFTSVDLVKGSFAYIARIAEVKPTLHAVLELNPDALDIAQDLDSEREDGEVRGPLHGLPILIKDIIGTKDKMQTTLGSYALVGAEVAEDATIVTKLRELGLVILGKTSVSEWANFRSMNSSNGWNARGGQTYGAYYPQQDPSGSSSGSAVSTDLGLAAFALGSETAGSILLPSGLNNVVGLKPTVGLVSRHMVIPISQRQDTIGSIGRTVKDAALLLQAIAGRDPKDNYTLASPFSDSLPDYLAACKLSGLQGKRIGIPRNVLSAMSPPDTDILPAFEAAVATIASAGATIIDNANFTSYADWYNSTTPAIVIASDFISDLPGYLSTLTRNPNNIHSLTDLRAFTQQSPLEHYPDRDTGVWDQALDFGMSNTSPAFWNLYQQNLNFGDEGGLLGALRRDNLDAVILPTPVGSDMPGIVGTPAISVPLGAYPNGTAVWHDKRGELVQAAPGIPFGISFLGPKWSEEALIGMAYAFEQRTGVRGKLRRVVEPRRELKDVVGEVVGCCDCGCD